MCKCTLRLFFHSLSLSGHLPTFAHTSVRQARAYWQMSTVLSHSFRLFFLTPPPLCVRLCVSQCPDAEVHFVNMTALTRGRLHSSFWIVDRTHIYIGSADMDWRSLSKVTANTDNTSVRGEIRTEDKWASAVRRGRSAAPQNSFSSV